MKKITKITKIIMISGILMSTSAIADINSDIEELSRLINQQMDTSFSDQKEDTETRVKTNTTQADNLMATAVDDTKKKREPDVNVSQDSVLETPKVTQTKNSQQVQNIVGTNRRSGLMELLTSAGLNRDNLPATKQLETVVDDSMDSDRFLRYLPADTTLTVQSDIFIPTAKTVFLYINGKEVVNVDNENSFTACYIQFNDYDKSRVLRSGRELIVETNYTSESTLDNGNTLYESKFGVTNEHINFIKCLTNKKTTPLTVSDFKDSFGELFSISYPEYEQI